MRSRRPTFFDPFTEPHDNEAPPTPGEIVGGLAGVALLGLGAYALHRQGKLGETVASIVEVLTGTPPIVDPAPPPRRRTKKRAGKSKRARAIPKPSQPPPPAPLTPEEEDAAAARLLGVRLDASADEVRAALRARVSERMSAGLGFGDTASNEREQQETIALNAAKNRLVERARRIWPR